MGVRWTGLDVGLNEVVSIAATQTFGVRAPSSNPYTLERLDFTCSVRAHFAGAGSGGLNVPENWWVSSEVLIDVVFATDGNDVLPDPTGGDERILYVTHLQPSITYAQVAGHYSVVYNRSPTEIQSKGKRKSGVLGSLPPTVFIHVTCFDQHGVFVNPGPNLARTFGIDISARALWRADF